LLRNCRIKPALQESSRTSGIKPHFRKQAAPQEASRTSGIKPALQEASRTSGIKPHFRNQLPDEPIQLPDYQGPQLPDSGFQQAPIV